MSTAKATIDWERIEIEYRAGVLSLREIAGPNGVTEGAIRKRAKRDGWERDLSEKIHAKADALVRRELVRTEYAKHGNTPTEREVIECSANRIAQVRTKHQSDIARSSVLAMKLLQELELQTDGAELLKQLGELMARPDERGADKLSDAYHKVISLPSRSGTMKQLSDTLKTLIGLEREAYGIASVTVEGEKPAQLNELSGNDLARRIAFALSKGIKNKGDT